MQKRLHQNEKNNYKLENSGKYLPDKIAAVYCSYCEDAFIICVENVYPFLQWFWFIMKTIIIHMLHEDIEFLKIYSCCSCKNIVQINKDDQCSEIFNLVYRSFFAISINCEKIIWDYNWYEHTVDNSNRTFGPSFE